MLSYHSQLFHLCYFCIYLFFFIVDTDVFSYDIMATQCADFGWCIDSCLAF